MAAPLAWAQSGPPANDAFANAQLLSGEFGTVPGDNTLATAESGEPAHAGVRASASLWYRWTAPSDGVVEFDTLNSAVDTALAVYVPTDPANPALATLNQVVANDDIHPTNPENAGRRNAPSDPFAANPYLGPSGVKFTTQAGTTYYIAVDGHQKNNSSLPGKGSLVLSWAYLKNAAGVFRLSAQNYKASEAESHAATDSTAANSAAGARVTVTRLFGAAGKVKVSFGLINPTNGQVAAVPGKDYQYPNSTNLLFEDFELSKSFIIPILDDAGPDGLGRRNPGRSGGVGQPDRFLTVFLSAVTADPNELTNPDLQLAPPRLEVSKSVATVRIVDLDYDPSLGLQGQTNEATALGVANFERACYRVTEGVGLAHISVYRVGGQTNVAREIHYALDSSGGFCLDDNRFDLQAGSDYAAPDSGGGPASLNPDFSPAISHISSDPFGTSIDGQGACYSGGGTLRWAANDLYPKDIWIPILDDKLPEFNEDISLQLFQITGHIQDLVPGNNSNATVTICFDDYPAGALDDAHNPDFNVATQPPLNAQPGADDWVYALAVQANDQTIIAGQFSSYNATPRSGIARLNKDGSLDATFNPGDGVRGPAGAPGLVTTVALTPDGKIVLGGNFNSYNGIPRANLARLNADGSLDTSFNPGLGADGTVRAVAVQTNGQVLVAGEFTSFDGQSRSHIARVNADGSLDLSFNPETNAPNHFINALALNPDGSVFIGGDFTAVGAAARSSVALLNPNGGLVAAFNPLTGLDGPVYALARQPDGKLLAGGAFGRAELRSRHNIARYNSNGTLDLSFDPGSGADDAVYAITLQPDGRIFLGGRFNSINGTRRMGVARLFATGEVDTGFLDTAYNEFAGLHKPCRNPAINPPDFLLATALQSDGNLMIGGSFHYVGGGRFSSLVQTNNQNQANGGNFDGVPFSRAAYRSPSNVARLLGGNTMGPGSLGLAVTNLTIPENTSSAFVLLLRTNGNLGPIESVFQLPPQPLGTGQAQSGTDYTYTRANPRYGTSWYGTRALSDGLLGTNNLAVDPLGGTHSLAVNLTVNVLNRPGVQGDRSAVFQLDLPSCADVCFLGGENVPLASALGRNTAALSIQEMDTIGEVISFGASDFYVNENQGLATLTLVRSNAYGLVNVRCATTNGTAIAGTDYVGATNLVNFNADQASGTFSFQILDDYIIQPSGEKTVQLYLFSPSGAALGTLSNATVHIIDDDFPPGRLNLSATNYVTNELAPAAVFTVTRTGGSAGTEEITFATSNLTAVAGVNYLAANGTLHWDDGDTTARFITVPLLHDGRVTPDQQFSVRLFNPSVAGSPGPRLAATCTILNRDFVSTDPAFKLQGSWSPSGCSLALAAPAGTLCLLQVSTNLTDWLPLVTNSVSASGVFQFTDPGAPGSPGRFYRAVQLLP